MKRFFGAIGRFFLPPADAKTFRRILPLAVAALIMVVIFAAGMTAWEETNTSAFCGLTCHTMPPQYITHNDSQHTNVDCEDCHMGRDKFLVLLPRKIRYSWQTGSAMISGRYEYPIIARNMAPAREACENCHKPEVFTSDKLVEITRYAQDENNTLHSTFLSMKTGGGAKREGLGYGIHWHIENPVYYLPVGKLEQEIPYVVVNKADGARVEYVDVASGFDRASLKVGDMKVMDCITCHNRAAHGIESPDRLTDTLINNNLVSAKIPEIKTKSVEALSVKYANHAQGLAAIAALGDFYRQKYPDFSAANQGLIDQAIAALQQSYERTDFPDQKMDWETHPNNIGHDESAGCFRCHDGKHLETGTGDAIRLECNLCHSIPVVSAPYNLTASLQLNKGFEPENHQNANWITIHRDIFDETCAGCHTTDDPGGTSNASFCSNSACHGATWKFAGFDAPAVRLALADKIAAMITPTPIPTPPDETGSEGGQAAQATPAPGGPLTYEALQGVLQKRCGACHGASAMKGLNVLSYAALMKGGEDGAVIEPGDPDGSLFIKIQSAASKHFGQFEPDELEAVKQWIAEGAKEK